MTDIMDVSQGELVKKTADKLKSVEAVSAPEWADYVKTGVSRERPPSQEDWWYSRSASVLLKLYKMGPLGVSKLKRYYGGKKNRGVQPEKFFKGSGSIVRKVMQQLEKAGFAAQTKIGVHKGRIITKQGKLFLDNIATEIKPVQKSQPKIEKKVEVKKQKPMEAKPKMEKIEAPKKEIKKETQSSKTASVNKPESKKK